MSEMNNAPCANCDSSLAADFCGVCGQRQRGRLTLLSLFKDGLRRVFDADEGFYKTFVTLFRYPGLPQRDYIDGRRRRYVNPITYYVVAASAQLLALLFTGELVAQSVAGNLQAETAAALEASGIADPYSWVGERYLLLIQNAYTWLGVITFILPMAVILRLILPGRLNMAEALVYSFYTAGHVILVTALVSPFTVPYSQVGHAIFSVSAYFLYALLSAGGCFGRKVWPIAAGFIAMLVGIVCFFSAIGVGAQLMFDPNFF